MSEPMVRGELVSDTAAMSRTLLLVICSLGIGCKEKPESVPPSAVSPVVAAKVATDTEFAARNSLVLAERAGKFEISDGAGRFKLVLPAKPTLSNHTASESGVAVLQAQAVMSGGDVDVQFAALSARDGEMPRDTLDALASTPSQLATAAGGTLAKNESGTLAGKSARVFELTTPDGRRLFGWYLVASEHGRMYQLNCVGADTPKSRAACETIAKSLTL